MPRWSKLRPSPAMVVACIAVVLALAGTAYAAATIVNIADPTTPAHVARVDANGALKTTSTLAAPRNPFFGFGQPTAGTPAQLIAPNMAQVALTRLTFSNPYQQTNGAHVTLQVIQRSASDGATCDGNPYFRTVAYYSLAAGQSVIDPPGSPIVLKPFNGTIAWCLVAAMTIEGSPGFYYTPAVAYSGFVQAGTLPSNAIPLKVAPSDKPRPITRG